GNTTITSVEIPNSVTNIGHEAFSGCFGLTSIEIPNSVTSIGWSAFSGCTGLKTVFNFSNLTFIKGSSDYGSIAYHADKVINAPNGFIDGDFGWFENEDGMTLAGYLGDATELTLPTEYNGKSVTSIGSYAFYKCSSLTSIVIPNSVTSIGDSVFSDCTGLTSVVIPSSVTRIGDSAFSGCTGLTSVVIPSSVTRIGYDAFYNCSGLKTVINFSNLTFSKGSSNYGYVAYYAEKVINATNGFIDGDFVLAVIDGVNTLACYLGNAAELVLPIDYNSENYVIGDYAFYGCSGLTNVVIPNSVTSIGNSAFEGCDSLKTVINLSNLTFSKGSSNDGYIAYYADKVINAPNGFIDGDFVFGRPNDVNTLLYYLGSENDLTLPTDCEGEYYVIGSEVFKNNTALTSVEIPNSVTSIGNYAFYGCSGLTSIVIPNSVTSIGDYAFYGCDGLTSIVIPNGVTSIGDSAFEGCANIENLYISNSLESIGEKAFAGCEKIMEIKIGLEKPIRGATNIFADAVYDNAILYVPIGTKSLYEKREPWNLFFYVVEMDFTGINEVKAENGKVEGVYYDLSGRAVENPANGIYILDGHKVIVK
ncbi:MAG: leucine-rich repeat domain-containing protein, partial [Bacteroidaceae bacterium]|nr:leucine-rich repeat domain-containing protein [Bacteroidaceae bacterium]